MIGYIVLAVVAVGAVALANWLDGGPGVAACSNA